MKRTAAGLAVFLIKLAAALGDGADDSPFLQSPTPSNFAPQPSARILKLFSEEAVNARFKAAAKNKEESRNLKGKFKSAATRAFSVEDIAGPEIAAILDGEPVVLSKGASEGAMIFATMAELAQTGCSSNDMEDEMMKRGFDPEYVWDVLSNDATMRDQVADLRMGLSQKELVDALLEMDDAVVTANEKITDPFGNPAVGPDSLEPPPLKRNKIQKPIEVGIQQDNWHSEGPASGLPKTERKGHSRRLVVAPAGCNVARPDWVGDGECDRDGGYNTEECNWDGGDCCPMTCVPGADYPCGTTGYDCQACIVDRPQYIGDGYCDRNGNYNTPECGYDGGDCCPVTCKDGDEFTCGVSSEYDCKCKPYEYVVADEPHKGRKGPGYKILNDTPHPVEISLWQASPLYHQLVQPGQWFKVLDPFGFAFTIKATINIDNEPRISNWDVFWPIAVIVASILLALVTMGQSAVLEEAVFGAVEEGTLASVERSVYTPVVEVLKKRFGEDAAWWVTYGGGRAARNGLTSVGLVATIEQMFITDMLGLDDNRLQVSQTFVGVGVVGKKTQAIRVHRGLKMEPVHLGNQCANVYFRDDIKGGARKGRKMKLSNISGYPGV